MANVSTMFKEIRNRAHFASHASLAKAMDCTAEYIRLIENKGRLPSDKFLSLFLRTCRPPASLATEIRQTVAEQRLQRKHGRDLKHYKSTDDVSLRICRGITEPLQDIGVDDAEDLEYVLSKLRELLSAELR
jgi:hypothetical protein